MTPGFRVLCNDTWVQGAVHGGALEVGLEVRSEYGPEASSLELQARRSNGFRVLCMEGPWRCMLVVARKE